MAETLSIYIPAFNEERTIASIVLLAKKYGRVVVVDDGSSDRTAALAAKAGARVVRRERNGGYGAAMKTIFSEAKKSGCRAFVVLDGDAQHDPDEIPLVSAPVLSGEADVCAGSRSLGGFVDVPAYRKTGVRFFNSLSGMKSGTKLDYQCGFRAFSSSAAGKIAFMQEGYASGPEILAAAQEAGLRIAQVPVHVRYYPGSGGNPLSHGAGLLRYFAGEMARQRPLLVFVGGGLLFLVASGALGLFVLDTFYTTRVLATGSAFLTVFFGILGLVLISIGINIYTLGTVLERRR